MGTFPSNPTFLFIRTFLSVQPVRFSFHPLCSPPALRKVLPTDTEDGPYGSFRTGGPPVPPQSHPSHPFDARSSFVHLTHPPTRFSLQTLPKRLFHYSLSLVSLALCRAPTGPSSSWGQPLWDPTGTRTNPAPYRSPVPPVRPLPRGVLRSSASKSRRRSLRFEVPRNCFVPSESPGVAPATTSGPSVSSTPAPVPGPPQAYTG